MRELCELVGDARRAWRAPVALTLLSLALVLAGLLAGAILAAAGDGDAATAAGALANATFANATASGAGEHEPAWPPFSRWLAHAALALGAGGVVAIGAAALALALAPAFALGAIGSALDGLVAELRRAKPDDYRALGGAEHAHAFYVARRTEYQFSLWCNGALTPARLCAVAGCGLMLLAVAAAIIR